MSSRYEFRVGDSLTVKFNDKPLVIIITEIYMEAYSLTETGWDWKTLVEYRYEVNGNYYYDKKFANDIIYAYNKAKE
jgi:hypothetical protein